MVIITPCEYLDKKRLLLKSLDCCYYQNFSTLPGSQTSLTKCSHMAGYHNYSFDLNFIASAVQELSDFFRFLRSPDFSD